MSSIGPDTVDQIIKTVGKHEKVLKVHLLVHVPHFVELKHSPSLASLFASVDVLTTFFSCAPIVLSLEVSLDLSLCLTY